MKTLKDDPKERPPENDKDEIILHCEGCQRVIGTFPEASMASNVIDALKARSRLTGYRHGILCGKCHMRRAVMEGEYLDRRRQEDSPRSRGRYD